MRSEAQAEVRDDAAMFRDVGSLQVVEEAAALADHLEEAAAAVMVLAVGAEVLSEVAASLGEDRNLHVGRARVGLVLAVLLNYRRPDELRNPCLRGAVL